MRRRLSLLIEKIGGRKSLLCDVYFFVFRTHFSGLGRSVIDYTKFHKFIPLDY